MINHWQSILKCKNFLKKLETVVGLQASVPITCSALFAFLKKGAIYRIGTETTETPSRAQTHAHEGRVLRA